MTDCIFELKNDLNKNGIFFCFSGPISQDLIVEIGDTLKNKMRLEDASKSSMRLVFSIIIEQAQNIIYYSEEKVRPWSAGVNAGSISVGIITVAKKDNSYIITSGNMIKTEHVDKLKEKIEKIKGMGKDELKQYYKSQRKKDPDEDSKGAGLGLIDIARKVSKPLEYNFSSIDETVSFFTVTTVVAEGL